MKTIILALLLSVGLVWGQQVTGQGSSDRLPNTRNSSTKSYLGGFASPLTFTGKDTLNGTAATSTTSWMAIGWSSVGSKNDNTITQRFGSRIFTLILGLDTWGAGDSVGLASARFETAWDTTGGYTGLNNEIWNADSTNLFMQSSASSHDLYYYWIYEPITADADSTTADTLNYSYQLRVQNGAYIRFVFTNVTALADTVVVNWKLICEH